MSASQRNIRIETTLPSRYESPQTKKRIEAWVKQVQLAGNTIAQPSMTNNMEDEPKYEKVFKGFVFRKYDKKDEKDKKDVQDNEPFSHEKYSRYN